MEKTFWDLRYSTNEAVYGIDPNPFFKAFIDTHKPGNILLPAEGEGRNALYASAKGWKVDAFDFSEVARDKALKKAKENGLQIRYTIQNLEDFKADKKYDAIALIYIHLPEDKRMTFHREIYKSLEPGGYLLLEAFAKEQVHNNSGGPKEPALLYDAPMICSDFQFLHMLSCRHRSLVLNEGSFHKGKADVLQMIGQKL